MEATVIPFDEAKAFLMKAESNGRSLYDHISDVVLKVLEKRPDGALGAFEELSAEVKKSHLEPSETENGAVKVDEDDTQERMLLEQKISLLKKAESKDAEADEEDLGEEPQVNEGELPNILEESSYFEHLGVGFSREDSVRLYLSLKELLEKNPLQSVRFFGKIFGTNGDYIIAETEFKEGEGEDPDANETPVEEEEEDRDEEEENDDGTPKKRRRWIPPPVPVERRVGANKFTYFVCHYIGGPWIRLPDVTPAQVHVSRKIKKLFTGDLDAPIYSYPPFEGNEANYLRAQIARIAAGTTIAPKGFYLSEGDEDEEAEAPPQIELNQDFEDFEAGELAILENWVHERPYILPQGRCTYWRPPKPPKERSEVDDEDEEDDAEDDDESSEPAESGPTVLSSIEEDAPVGPTEAWSFRSSSLLGSVGPIFLSSNRWPGAYTFSSGRKFASVYFGNGQAFTGAPYTPPAPPVLQTEAPELEEALDPTVAQERELEEKNKPPEEEDDEDLDDEEDDEDDE